MHSFVARLCLFVAVVGLADPLRAQQPPALPGPASGGWSVLMAPYASIDNTAKCTAFVLPQGQTPYGLDVRKTFGPFQSADEAELSLRRSGWNRISRFNQGGSQWIAASGC